MDDSFCDSGIEEIERTGCDIEVIYDDGNGNIRTAPSFSVWASTPFHDDIHSADMFSHVILCSGDGRTLSLDFLVQLMHLGAVSPPSPGAPYMVVRGQWQLQEIEVQGFPTDVAYDFRAGSESLAPLSVRFAHMGNIEIPVYQGVLPDDLAPFHLWREHVDLSALLMGKFVDLRMRELSETEKDVLARAFAIANAAIGGSEMRPGPIAFLEGDAAQKWRRITEAGWATRRAKVSDESRNSLEGSLVRQRDLMLVWERMLALDDMEVDLSGADLSDTGSVADVFSSVLDSSPSLRPALDVYAEGVPLEDIVA